MNTLEIIEIGREGIYVLLKMSLPLMLVAMGVGLAISLFQALTQIQEMTLAFVPKIIAVFFSMLILMPYLAEEMTVFHESMTKRIANIE